MASQPKVRRSPLIVYRIGDSRFLLFDGRGAMLSGGRWNSPGHPVVYASLSQSCAMLEILAHTNIGKLPKHHKLITAEIPGSLKIEAVNPENLPGWNDRSLETSRHFGDAWLHSLRSVALIVPSVIAPHDRNIAINPLHADFSEIKTNTPEDIGWDSRLFKKK